MSNITIQRNPTPLEKYFDEMRAEIAQLRTALAEARAKLDRYEFDERSANNEHKKFAAEIAAAHPTESNDPDSDDRYVTALALVSERHGKYELVDLVHWLLTERDTARAKEGQVKP
jgi:hypothetical protein